MKTVIKAENLTKTFGEGDNKLTVLKNINLEIKEGEFTSIMGPSGCGKSTLLYLLGGLDAPSDGKVLVEEKDINKMKDKEKSRLRREDIGFVFQFYNLVQNLTVEENIMLPLVMAGKKTKDYKDDLEEILMMVGLKDKRKVIPSKLSGGQQQRVSIGRALMNSPAVVLADEPTGNLDSKNSQEIMQLLRESNEKYHQTLIMITHDENIAVQADRIIAIEDGLITRDEVMR